MTASYEHLSPSLGVQIDAFGNPVGKDIPDWQGCERLPDRALAGRFCRLAPYAPEHAPALFDAFARDDGGMWSYLTYGPFPSAAHITPALEKLGATVGFHPFVILVDDVPAGFAGFMRYDLASGCVEVGGVTFSPALRRTAAATEAMYLMMKHAFDHGYRRYEWKCNQLNRPSNLAALRLGFQFEGVFRNAQISGGKRRDTAWYSVIAEDWPAVRARLEAWLDPANFDADGVQRQSLRALPAVCKS